MTVFALVFVGIGASLSDMTIFALVFVGIGGSLSDMTIFALIFVGIGAALDSPDVWLKDQMLACMLDDVRFNVWKPLC